MYFLLDAEISQGPPPQAVLEKRPLWMLLLVMLLATAVLRFIVMDLIGGILSFLMLILAGMMVANGMADLCRYAVSFTALSMLFFCFDIMPLLASMTGRTEVVVEPGNHTQTLHTTLIDYTTAIKTTPFFYEPAGLLYNVASFSMLLSPTTMVLAMYLSSHAHVEAHRSALSFRQWAGELLNDTLAPARPVREGPFIRGRGGRRGAADSGGHHSEAHNDNSFAAANLLRYHGISHRLDDC
eukprot:TRINITY_DN76600_c0_g1_i1.p1 TRINITY_DN76600_c0_g1~~TRINITY_DN76600_c0_g1_i1.p1  ORF type:complete len:240 (-),score=12.94 TRINITY_DN76600_c0_g1_i1:210-929(-)